MNSDQNENSVNSIGYLVIGLEIRFGENFCVPRNYTDFSNRKPKTKEYLAALAVDLARIMNPFLRQTLQLEEAKSLRKVVTKAIEIEDIQKNNNSYFLQNHVMHSWDRQIRQFSKTLCLHRERMERKNIGANFSKNRQNQNESDKRRQPRNVRECWTCKEVGLNVIKTLMFKNVMQKKL
ncbi:hypothetical protein V1478_001674 [Vespula squamosa]|uniref:Uncharacterized protein n=1 Tax=Vespula squamosa TaxID=30214 RepID=A0ABD2BXS2_VESSQ